MYTDFSDIKEKSLLWCVFLFLVCLVWFCVCLCFCLVFVCVCFFCVGCFVSLHERVMTCDSTQDYVTVLYQFTFETFPPQWPMHGLTA